MPISQRVRGTYHRGKLSVWAVDRDLQDDHSTPHMDRHSNPGKPPWDAGAKDIRLRFDRGCPKPRRHVEPGQSSAEIVGERRQRTAMHMAAIVEMTVIDIEFADQLILVGVGNAYAEVSRHTGTGGGRSHSRAPIRGKDCGRSFTGAISSSTGLTSLGHNTTSTKDSTTAITRWKRRIRKISHVPGSSRRRIRSSRQLRRKGIQWPTIRHRY